MGSLYLKKKMVIFLNIKNKEGKYIKNIKSQEGLNKIYNLWHV